MILDRFRVDDKVAVVTGAGRGIGAASAVALAEAGADVLLSARSADQLEDVARAVKAAGRRAYVVPADLMDLEAVADLADQAYEEFGRLDIVVNNVGGTIPNALLDTDAAYLEEAFHFNVSTAHALTRSAVPQMLRNDGGSVVNISSVVGQGRRSRLPRLRHGEGRAGPLHPAGRAGPEPDHPRQRDRGRQRDDQRAGVRGQRRGHDERDDHARHRSAGWARSRTSPRQCST